MSELSKQEYIETLEKLEKQPVDVENQAGQLLSLLIGGGAGYASSGVVASWFGATTLLGSSGLASILGGVFVVSNPIGWVVGSIVAGATVATVASKLVSNGAKYEEKKQSAIRELKVKIDKYRNEVKNTPKPKEEQIGKVAGAFRVLLENDLVEQEQVRKILEGVEKGHISSEYAIDIAHKILNESISNNDNDITESNIIIRSAFILLYKYMINVDKKVDDKELKKYEILMKNSFNISNEYAISLYQETPLISEIDSVLKDLKNIVPPELNTELIQSLIQIGHSDLHYHTKEKEFVAKVRFALGVKE